MRVFFLALKIWLTVLPVAFANGTVRILFLNTYVGEKAGHIVSTLMLSTAIVFIIYFFLKKTGADFTRKNLLMVGLFLVIMTMIFEFGLGRITGKSWEFLLADYNILAGKIWPLVLVTEFLSPFAIKLFLEKNMHKVSVGIVVGIIGLVLVATLVVVGSVALRNKEQKMGNIEAPVVSDPDAPIIKKLCENRGDPTETAILFKCGKYYQKFPPTSALDLPSNLYDEEGVNVGNCGGNRNPDMPNSKGCEVSCDKQNLCLKLK